MYLAACLRRFLPQHDADVYVIEVVDNMMIGGKEAHIVRSKTPSRTS